MAYTYDPIFAADPNNPAVVASNAAILIYDPADTGKAPIEITDSSGSPLSNPITVSQHGFGPAFQHPTIDRVAWQGGGFEGFFTSYEGLKNAALDAAEAAAASAGEAAVSAALVGAPADSAVQTLINAPASATRVKLDATYAPVTGSTAYATPAAVTAAVAPKLDSATAATTYATPVQAVAPPVEIMAATLPFAVPSLDTMPPTVTVTNNQALDGTPTAAGLITDRKTNAGGWYTTIAPTDLTKQRYFAPSALQYDAGAPNPDTWSIDFSHGGITGAVFSHEIQIRGGQIIQYMLKQKAGASFRIMVNGKYLTSTAVTLGGTAGSLAFITLDFGAPILAPVNLTFEAVNTRFYSVIQQNATTVTKVPGPDPKKILFAGDSYWESSGLVTGLTSMTKTAGWLLGYRNNINSSIGGSGYIATGNQGQPALGGRVTADIVNQAPDVVVVGMGHNDTPSSNAAIQAAAQSAVQAIRDGLPNAKIIVTGPLFSTPTPGVYTAMQAAIFAGVAGVSGVVTVDTVGGPWITAANQAKYVSSDGTHPIQIGHDYFGHRIAAAIATATRVTF